MPGTMYRVLSKEPFDFSTLAANQSQTVLVAKGLDVSSYREAVLVVRIHPGQTITQSPTIKVDAYAEAPTTEDPANDYIMSTAAASTGNVALAGISTPYLNMQTLSVPFGGFVRVQIVGTQGGTAGTIKLTMSIDLVAKS